MTSLMRLHDQTIGGIARALDGWFLPTAARFVFAAVLLFYFWNSGLTKLGDGFLGFLSPSDNAYIQIFPKTVEALGYDTSQLGAFHWLIATAGTIAEFVLPFLIIVGLMTRLAAVGMIGFVIVQSIVDVQGHGISGQSLGGWFDGPSGSVIMDQRLLWVLLLMILFVKGAGPISLDRIFGKSPAAA